MNKISYKPGNQVPRWLGYFDLLDTSELIRSGKTVEVFLAYQEAISQLSRWQHANVLHHAWFSDTFIAFTGDDSVGGFGAIEQVCRWFAFALIIRKIPVRIYKERGQAYTLDTPSSFSSRPIDLHKDLLCFIASATLLLACVRHWVGPR